MHCKHHTQLPFQQASKVVNIKYCTVMVSRCWSLSWKHCILDVVLAGINTADTAECDTSHVDHCNHSTSKNAEYWPVIHSNMIIYPYLPTNKPAYSTSQTSRIASVSTTDASTSLADGNRYSGRSILNQSCSLHAWNTTDQLLNMSLFNTLQYFQANTCHVQRYPTSEVSTAIPLTLCSGQWSIMRVAYTKTIFCLVQGHH